MKRTHALFKTSAFFASHFLLASFLILLWLCLQPRSTLRLKNYGRPNELPTCVFTLAFDLHFKNLAIRLAMTLHLSEEWDLPPHYIVFDDSDARGRFCAHYGRYCNHPHIHALMLSDLLGKDVYSRVRDTLFGPNSPENYMTASCERTPNRIYQALKKFAGTSALAGKCGLVWVSDAESLPLRPFNFTQLFEYPHEHVVSTWYENKYGCTQEYDWHHDQYCGQITAERLRLDSSWDAPSWQMYDFKKGSQTIWEVGNWIFHDPILVKRIIQRSEEVTGTSFPDFWLTMHDSDSSFYGHHVEYFAAVDPKAVGVKNFIDEMAISLPNGFSKCCNCSQGAQAPCREISSLWSNCMNQYESWDDRVKFLVEGLGIFGTWSIYWNMPLPFLEADPRFSWCVNNCDYQNLIHLEKHPLFSEAFSMWKTLITKDS